MWPARLSIFLSSHLLYSAIVYLFILLQILGPKKDSPLVYQRGLYPCDIRLNFAGIPEAEMLRRELGLFDNNAFVTLWVSVILLEAARFKDGPVPTDQQLELALEAVGSYHDLNYPPGDGLLVFWPQSYNSTSKKWYCYPANAAKAGDDVLDIFAFFHKALDALGLERVWNTTLEPIEREL